MFQDELLEIIQNNLARRWVQQNMLQLGELEEPNVTTRASMDRVLEKYGKNIGLEKGETKDFYHRYDIEGAKELEPLYKAYLAYIDDVNIMEGRGSAPEKKLTKDDFWKLFFDGGESFSATGDRYQVSLGRRTSSSRPSSSSKRTERRPSAASRDRACGRQRPGGQVADDFVVQGRGEAVPLLEGCRGRRRPAGSAGVGSHRAIEQWKFNKAREKEVLPAR